jgi:hypothetical protein
MQSRDLLNVTNREFEECLRRDLPPLGEAGKDSASDAPWMPKGPLKDWDIKAVGSSIVFGFRNGRFIGRVDDRHLLTVAGPRSGKTLSLLRPNL